ncbi:ribonuclease P protein component [Sphingobacterium psychroaquaticum]|uniref:ribonuclease P protein component n=1 Tax=Sphingobacterium psychroaquaticum TaxID=561061 RepID=UPI001F0EAE87|nr:ribonuclease P protein component [Sphingobacterium psychroaquaticum]
MGKTFTKEERLCSKRLIDDLFHNSFSFVLYPYRIVFQPKPSEDHVSPAQSILSVSKRRFKRAVDRNAVKRRMREAFRLQKEELYLFLQEHSLNLLVAFQYVGKEQLPYVYMYERMGLTITKLKDEITNSYLGKPD